jgi:hypothetical protein
MRTHMGRRRRQGPLGAGGGPMCGLAGASGPPDRDPTCGGAAVGPHRHGGERRLAPDAQAARAAAGACRRGLQRGRAGGGGEQQRPQARRRQLELHALASPVHLVHPAPAWSARAPRGGGGSEIWGLSTRRSGRDGRRLGPGSRVGAGGGGGRVGVNAARREGEGVTGAALAAAAASGSGQHGAGAPGRCGALGVQPPPRRTDLSGAGAV